MSLDTSTDSRTADTSRRTVTVERTGSGRFRVANARGGHVVIGTGGDTDFTPTELLLASIGGCTAIDVDVLTARRSEPAAFAVVVDATKVRDDEGNRLTDIEVTFRITFPDDEGGAAARDVLPDIVRRSHDRLCTVGRTVEVGTHIGAHIV
jgi:putative redox protein